MSNIEDEETISPAQCRAARALLNWSQTDLETKAGVARKTLADFEGGKRKPYERTLAEIRATLEKAGVVLLASGETKAGGAGVRLKKGREG